MCILKMSSFSGENRALSRKQYFYSGFSTFLVEIHDRTVCFLYTPTKPPNNLEREASLISPEQRSAKEGNVILKPKKA